MFYFLLFSVTARIGGTVSVIYPDKMLTIVYQLAVACCSKAAISITEFSVIFNLSINFVSDFKIRRDKNIVDIQ